MLRGFDENAVIPPSPFPYKQMCCFNTNRWTLGSLAVRPSPSRSLSLHYLHSVWKEDSLLAHRHCESLCSKATENAFSDFLPDITCLIWKWLMFYRTSENYSTSWNSVFHVQGSSLAITIRENKRLHGIRPVCLPNTSWKTQGRQKRIPLMRLRMVAIQLHSLTYHESLLLWARIYIFY